MCIWWSTRLAVLLGRSENRESVNRSVGMPIPQSAKISSINSWVLLSGYCVLLFLFSHPVMSDSETPWTAARQASLSLTISWNLPKFMFIALVMLSSHLIFWCPLLLLPSIFPSIRTFPMSGLFTSDDQNTGASASASVLSVNNQGWSPWRVTDLISLLSKGLSEVSLAPQASILWCSAFFMVQLSQP